MDQDFNLYSLINEHLDTSLYRELNWTGSFHDYLQILHENPNVARNAFQRIYDMVISYGKDEIPAQKGTLEHYKFFDDPIDNGKDAVFGLHKPCIRLVNFFKSAAHNYGTERRVLLLHGPVGSSKSTIVRLLKKGLEQYSRTDEGALYTFSWNIDGELIPSPMHEEPLLLIPEEARNKVIDALNKNARTTYKLRAGMPVGCKVTLRRDRMYEFLDRLITVALPRVRDFRGVSSKSFDGRGNFAMGLKEQIVFPEIDYDKVDEIRGLDIVICTTAKTNEEAKALLKGFDMPFPN